MRDAFKTKAKIAARGAAIDAARAMLRPTLLRQPVVAKVFNSLPVAARADARLSLYASSDVVYIALALRGLDSFKDARLVNVLSKFADWNANTTDYTGSTEPNRDYHFTREFVWDHDKRSIAYKKIMKEQGHITETFGINVSVYAYVKEDSATCRIVVKEREEVVKREERFIVCD
jgi:hypothetical protein